MALPEAVREALDLVWAGARGDEAETASVDFKEDPVHYPQQRNSDAKAEELIVDAAVCFANGEEEVSYIIFGVSDRGSGPSAFTGTKRDASDLAAKVFQKTMPQLHVEAWPVEYRGQRLILFRVPRGRAVYATARGTATYRAGKKCEPLAGEYRRNLEYRRMNPDHTARPSELKLSELSEEALAQGRVLLENQRQTRGAIDALPATTEGLLSTLDLLRNDGHLTIAAEILFAQPSGDRPLVRYHYRSTPAGEPKTMVVDQPLVLAATTLQRRIKERASEELARVHLGLGQEVPIPYLPAQAIDEAVTNALVHRDWALLSPIVIDQSPMMLKVSSPGGLPSQVRADRLLSTPSRPRNQLLMYAMNKLGLAEQASRGFDRMWLSMLSSGRNEPDVETDEYHVDVTLYAEEPDEQFLRFLAGVRETYGADFARDVNVVIALKYLIRHPVLSAVQAGKIMQTSERDARQNLLFMAHRGFIEEFGEGWALSEKTRTNVEFLPGALPVPVSLVDWIEGELSGGRPLTNRQIAEATGVPAREVTAALRKLRAEGLVRKDPEGPSRGAGVLWRGA
ncbi:MULTISPECIES: ATP-binding protein [unclassified Corynebacterium]|uniref:ATP-binding protein n=1 Tax=unclassified Corynebacterium TaxID=2624378 RepID=UPI0029CAA796|nr:MULTISPECIES: ATP-binding protein [unclassified Corynebacterium]WPF65979.1 ATP-binding protein [Corynebacterium sp. 22KM0430]WPF68472.1 ATP-binding protein [Corynebacterium sp. 21KM1197]